MNTILFGLSAPIALDSMVASGDELVIACLVLVLIGLVQNAGAVLLGVTGAGVILASQHFSASAAFVSLVPWLPLVIGLTGLLWTIKSVTGKWLVFARINKRQFSLALSGEREGSKSIQWAPALLAGTCSFSVTLMLGLDAGQELREIAGPAGETLPQILGVVGAVVNVGGIGACLILLLVTSPSALFSDRNSQRLLAGTVLIAMSIYFGGKSLGTPWPGNELVIVAIAFPFWFLSRKVWICIGNRKLPAVPK